MNDKKKHIFDNPKNVQRLLYGFYACCVLLIGIDFFFHRHVAHPWEEMFGFYGLYGFLACTLLVIIAKQIRKIIMRDESYYDRNR